MPELTPAAPAPLARITGRRRDWMRDATIVGLVSGYTGPAWVLYGPSLHPHLVACALTGGVAGVLMGAVAPDLLEQLRRRVSLRTLMVVLPLLAFFLGTGMATLAASAVGAPMGAASRFGAVALAGQVALFWLPYTVATVLEGPRWPVVLAACALSPLLGPVALAFAMLF